MVHGDASGMSVPTDDAFVRPPPMTDETQCKVAEMRHRVDALGVPKDLAEWADDACLYPPELIAFWCLDNSFFKETVQTSLIVSPKFTTSVTIVSSIAFSFGVGELSSLRFQPCFRYLRARQLNVDKAMAMLENSLKWRQEFGVGKIMTENMDDIRYLGQVGCNYVHGKDQLGRPVIYMKPRVQLKDPGTQRQQMRHLVYTLERAIWSMENDVEKYVLLIDFNGYSMRTAPNISTQRETMSILQDQYPERLGLAVFVDAPFLFHQTFKLLRPFVDPVTAQKLVFTSGKEKEAFFRANFNLQTLEKEYFGEDAHQYDPEQYFATMPRIAA